MFNHLFKKPYFGYFVAGLFFVINWIASTHHDSYFWEHILTIKTDSLGYYQYLPGFFIENDIHHLKYAKWLDNGNSVNVFHIGVAILQLPAFAVAYAYGTIAHGSITGYESCFAIAQYLGLTFYLALAFYWLWRLAKRWCSNYSALFLMLIFYLGSNLLYYSVREFGMSHAYSFFLFSGIMHYTGRFYEKPNWLNGNLLVIMLGIAFLIKPNNGVIILYPLLYNANSLSAFKGNLKLIFSNYKNWIIGAIAFVGFMVLQMLYWNAVTGEYLIFSYGKIDEGFNFLSPELFKVLFSPQNGWFIYTPIALVGVVLLMVRAGNNALNSRVSLLILFFAWYVFSSWWAWWFGAAYGHRAFIEYLPLLVPPFAWFFGRLEKNKKALVITAITLMLFTYINVGMTINYHAPWDGPDWGWDNYFHELVRVF